MSWEKLNMHKAANQARQSGSHAAMMSLIESAWEINVMSPLRTLEIKCPRVERLHITYTHQKRVEEAILTSSDFSFSHNGWAKGGRVDKERKNKSTKHEPPSDDALADLRNPP